MLNNYTLADAAVNPVFQNNYQEIIELKLDPILQTNRKEHGYGQMWNFGVPGDYANSWLYLRNNLPLFIKGDIESIAESEIWWDKSEIGFSSIRNFFRYIPTFLERYGMGDIIEGRYNSPNSITMEALYKEPDTAIRYKLLDGFSRDMNSILGEMERNYTLFKNDPKQKEDYRTALIESAKKLVGLLGAISIHRFPSPVSIIQETTTGRVVYAIDWNSDSSSEEYVRFEV